METIELDPVVERKAIFTELYKELFPAVAKYISKMGGSLDEAKDVFHDALIIYYEKEMETVSFINSSPNSYIFGIVKHLWLRNYREQSLTLSLEDYKENFAENTDDQKVPSHTRILNYLETAGRKCLSLLKSFYYDKMKMEEAAAVFGYSSIRSATVQKYKCLEKVRNKIKEHKLNYEDFTGRD